MIVRKHIPVKAIVVAILSIGVFSFARYQNGPGILPANAKNFCAISPAEFNSWFESGKVSLNGAVKPANSLEFPDSTNAGFYKWAEQMFLWLTSPAPGRYGSTGGLVFESPAFYDISPPGKDDVRNFLPHEPGKTRKFFLSSAQLGPHSLPVVFEKNTGRMLEIEKIPARRNGARIILDYLNGEVEVGSVVLDAANRPVFMDMAGKPIRGPKKMIHRGPEPATNIVQKWMIDNKPVFVGANGIVEIEEGQAGGADVLVSQGGSLVYYSITVNQVYTHFRSELVNGGLDMMANYPTTQAELDKFTTLAAAHGQKIIDPQALAVGIKTSWVEADKLPDPGNYIRVKATIPLYIISTANKWIPNGEQTVELALVGMHISGSVKGHPEMVWATFEHINNTPNEEYSYTNTANRNSTVPQNTAGRWNFCADNAAGPFNQSHMYLDGENIIARPGFTVGASNTMRLRAWGLGNFPKHNALAISANNNVRNKLMPGDVRRNYIMNGVTWSVGDDVRMLENQRGAVRLSNTTMETYVQGSNKSFIDGTGCFTCHASYMPKHSRDGLEQVAPLFRK